MSQKINIFYMFCMVTDGLDEGFMGFGFAKEGGLLNLFRAKKSLQKQAFFKQ